MADLARLAASARARSDLAAMFERARARRAELAADPGTTAYRLADGEGDDLAGLTLDRFGDVLVLSLYRDLELADEAVLVKVVADVFGPRSVYLKRRPREARTLANTARPELAPEGPAWGEAVPELVALENNRRHLIRPGGDLSVGLFLDMRETREWLAPRVRGRTMLNTFAYTCGFGLVASLGGAGRAVNLDLSRRVLDWGMENYRENGLSPERQDFVSGDVFDWLARLGRRGECFDVVVLDPPSFATARGSRFSAAADYGRLAALAAPVVAPGGLLLACCNHAGLARRAFLGQLERGLADAGRRFGIAASLGQSSADFPVPEGLDPPLKVFALEL